MPRAGKQGDQEVLRDRLELLLFQLGGSQRFGINVLKVREVIPTPHLTQVPHSHSAIRGVAKLRGETLSVIDLSAAIGRPPLVLAKDRDQSIIISEFNRTMQGFLVDKVERIAVCDWSDVAPPPAGSGIHAYTTGVTRVDGELVQILDIERVLGEVIASDQQQGVSRLAAQEDLSGVAGSRVMVVDDSMMARNQTAQTLDTIGVEYVMARDGREALDALRQLVAEGWPVDMVISDIEMPEMDGYTLAREVRRDPALSEVYILLHTSLNGGINIEKAHRAGANDALTKFVPEELAGAVIRALSSNRKQSTS